MRFLSAMLIQQNNIAIFYRVTKIKKVPKKPVF